MDGWPESQDWQVLVKNEISQENLKHPDLISGTMAVDICLSFLLLKLEPPVRQEMMRWELSSSGLTSWKLWFAVGKARGSIGGRGTLEESSPGDLMCTCAKRKEKIYAKEALPDSEFLSTQNSEFFRFSMADKSEKLRVKPLAQKGK